MDWHHARSVKRGLAASAVLAAALFAPGVNAQAVPPLKPETEASKALIAKASKTAGKQWPAEVHFFCEAPRANAANDPVIEPSKIFDNVYAIGRTTTVVYAITTTQGILLIDAGYPNDVEPVLLEGMKKLGLDPAQIKAILVTHGHADHFGGATYLQQHYGAHVYVSAADWNFMENPPAGRGGKGKGPSNPLPKHDQVLTEGQAVTVGDETVLPVAVPGHTPGSMGFLFEVKDRGKTHRAALFGGTILLPQNASTEVLKQYLASVAHFKAEAKKYKVDVELQNHPMMDDFEARLARRKQSGGANPFIVGQAGYGRFLDVMSDCVSAQLAR